jgi:DNA-binding Lrp family transcriptional regulator
VRVFAGEETVSRGRLSAFEKRLCNALQNGLPISERPYAEIGRVLGCEEEVVLKQTRKLVAKGLIRRIGAVVNWRAAGKASTLVAACVPEGKLKKVVAVVNGLDGVSHNYLRRHRYNLWFTIRADSNKQLEAILGDLSRRFGIVFHSLPVRRVFKLDVRFDAESGGRRLLAARLRFRLRRGKQKLDEVDERILGGLQKGLEVAARPYDFLCEGELKIDEVLARIDKMINRGVIYRAGAVVNHHKLGFVANAMFVCKVNRNQVVEVGEALARLQNVSHCYERKPFEGWPYRIFAMMHGRSGAEIRRVIDKFVEAEGIKEWYVLATVKRN